MSDQPDPNEPTETDGSADLFNRRNFIRALSMSGGTAALVAALGEGKAMPSTRDAPREEVSIEGLSSDRADQVIRKIRNTRGYKILVDHLKSTEDLVVDEPNTEVYLCETPDEPGVLHTGILPLASTEGKEYSQAGMAVKLRQGEVRSIFALRTGEISENVHEIVLYGVSNGEVRKNTIALDTEAMTAGAETATT